MTDEQVHDVSMQALMLFKACNQCCLAVKEIERVSLFTPLEDAMLSAMQRLADIAADKSRELTRLCHTQSCGILLTGCAEAAANNVCKAHKLIKNIRQS